MLPSWISMGRPVEASDGEAGWRSWRGKEGKEEEGEEVEGERGHWIVWEFNLEL